MDKFALRVAQWLIFTRKVSSVPDIIAIQSIVFSIRRTERVLFPLHVLLPPSRLEALSTHLQARDRRCQLSDRRSKAAATSDSLT